MLKTQCLPCVLMLIFGCCGIECSAESVVIATTFVGPRGGLIEENGTAVCIYSNSRGSILVTCKHVVETNPRSVWVRHANDWHQCGEIRLHPTEDIAILETAIELNATPLSDGIADGSDVLVEGAGPALAKTDEAAAFRGRVTSEGIISDDGLAVIPGDSGCPVYVRTASGSRAVGGIAYGYLGSHKCSRRTDHSGSDSITLYTPVSAFYPWIQTQYCQNGKCPIQIRPQVIYPVGPLGFQRGPSRVIGIAEPVPQQYVPVQPELRPVPDPISSGGIPGPRGPQGAPGRDGEPGRSVQQIEVEATVNAWLDSNIDRIRGPQGPQGPQGEPGRDGSSTDVSGLESRLTTIEKRKFRMVISSDGKIIDDESFNPGEPVVLDLKRLRSVSGGR